MDRVGSENKKLPKDTEIKSVAFFGDAASDESTREYKDAFETAKLLAQEGYAVVNGGGPGVMEAATKGAESVGGDTLVVTFYPEHATGFEGRYLGNRADEEVETKNYIERMFTLMEKADLYLIFKGGTGTVSEFGTAWVLAKLYHGHHKPFVLVGSFWRPIIEAIHKNLNIDEVEMEVFRIVDSRDEVLTAIHRLEGGIKRRKHDHDDAGEEEAFMT